MPTFSNRLPEKKNSHGYELRRTPPDKPIRGLITSETFYVVETHYWGGRTCPCEGDDCKACESNSPTRTHVYVSVLEAKTHDHFILEITGTAAIPLEDYQKAHGSLRGCDIKTWRPKRVKNGRVEIIAKPYDLTNIALPREPNLPKALCVIWQVPADAIVLENDGNKKLTLAPDSLVFAAQKDSIPDGNGKAKKLDKEFLERCVIPS